MTNAPPLVLLAHGSPDARHARDIETLRRGVQQRAGGAAVYAAYLDHHGPGPTEIGAVLGRDLPGADAGPIVLIPTLLTRAFHVQVDIPAAARVIAEASGREVVLTDALGPHPLIGSGLAALLTTANTPPDTGVVVYLAGSSRRAAVDELADGIRASLTGLWEHRVATLDAYLPLEKALAELGAGERHTVGVSCMIAEGVLRDRMVERCAERGVAFVPGVLAETDALTELILVRAREALANRVA